MATRTTRHAVGKYGKFLTNFGKGAWFGKNAELVFCFRNWAIHPG